MAASEPAPPPPAPAAAAAQAPPPARVMPRTQKSDVMYILALSRAAGEAGLHQTAMLERLQALPDTAFNGLTPHDSLRSNALLKLKYAHLVDQNDDVRSLWRLHRAQNDMAGWSTGRN